MKDLDTFAEFLTKTTVPIESLFDIVRGINNVKIGTGIGRVIIHMKGEEIFIQIREDVIRQLPK